MENASQAVQLDQKPTEKTPQAAKFGTFLGVYMPSLLTILGLIMYLRFGWVVGNIGLGLTFVVVILACSITFITGLSASAIATNMKVGAGGEYFMISRSLGLELGGAIGIPLYFCRTLSLTFYCFGLAEAIIIFMPETALSHQQMVMALAAAFIVFTTILSGKSASLVLKMQIPILIAVVLSVLALVVGVLTGGELKQPEWEATYRTAPEGFWFVFAVFFPAVTGFTAGIGMSGDLKDPQKSIPVGTMGAIVTGLILYMLIPVFLAITTQMSPEQLANSGVETWTTVAFLGAWLVYPAIWGAILSSAFGSILSGPRVLQALANDGLAPKIFTKLSKTGQPALATWVTGAIALLAVLLGGLNTVAMFVSILFLTLYVMVNLSAVVEKLVGDPSYRPTINVPWFVSVLGAIGAILVMFLVSPLACLFAVILELILYFFLKKRSLQKEWGDARAGFWFSLARYALLNHKPHGNKARNWRPYILAFVGNPAKRGSLLRLATWFSHKSGIVTATYLVEGNLTEDRFSLDAKMAQMNDDIRQQNLNAFGEINVVSNFEEGAVNVAQANGIAGMKSKTVLFGWSDKESHLATHLRIMRAVSQTGISTIIAKLDWGHEPGQDKSIHLWWGGQRRNGDLMLLLAHLLNSNAPWRKAKLTIYSIVKSDTEAENMESQLQAIIPKTRIKADVKVVVNHKGESVRNTIHRHSGNADVVFLGLAIPANGEEDNYANSLKTLASGLKTTIFVHNGEKQVPVLLSLEEIG
ncbi:MAG: amino acid permease [Bacteroidota bacterium]